MLPIVGNNNKSIAYSLIFNIQTHYILLLLYHVQLLICLFSVSLFSGSFRFRYTAATSSGLLPGNVSFLPPNKPQRKTKNKNRSKMIIILPRRERGGQIAHSFRNFKTQFLVLSFASVELFTILFQRSTSASCMRANRFQYIKSPHRLLLFLVSVRSETLWAATR